MLAVALAAAAACRKREQSAGTGAAGTGAAAGAAAASAGAWKTVPSTAPCAIEVADPAQLAILPWTWTACGAGCQTSPAKVLASDDTVYNAMTSARVQGGDVLIKLATTGSPPYKMLALRRLSDGALVGAARAPGPTSTTCTMLPTAPSATNVLGFGQNGTTVVGFLQAGRFTWSPPMAGVPTGTSVFENDLGWGMAFYDGSIRTMFPPSAAALTTIDQGGYPSYDSVGRASLVVSNPAPTGSVDEVIRAWEPTRPSRTIVAQKDTGIPSIALSDTSLVWVGTHGPNHTDGSYAAAELYWTASPSGKDAVAIGGGTALPAIAGLLSLQTWGDFAAVLGTDQANKLDMFVVRLSDGRLWTIHPRPGAVYVRVLAVTPTEILFDEVDDSGDPSLSWQLQRLTRYALAQLDTLAAAW